VYNSDLITKEIEEKKEEPKPEIIANDIESERTELLFYQSKDEILNDVSPLH
jgi:rubrerythrin